VIFEIEVFPRPPLKDALGLSALSQARHAGIAGVDDIASSRVYFLKTDVAADQVDRAAQALMADPVSELYRIRAGDGPWSAKAPRHVAKRRSLLVTRKPGVMDPVEASLLMAARDLGVPVQAAHTGLRYYVRGQADDATLDKLARRVLANECIESATRGDQPYEFREGHPYTFRKIEVPITRLNDDELQKLSRSAHLFLSLAEMRAIRDHYRAKGREPSDIELESLAQTWSEHCVHKTMKGIIDYRGDDGPEVIDNL